MAKFSLVGEGRATRPFFETVSPGSWRVAQYVLVPAPCNERRSSVPAGRSRVYVRYPRVCGAPTRAAPSKRGHLEFTMALMFAALVVAASSGAMILMNSVEGDSATEITS